MFSFIPAIYNHNCAYLSFKNLISPQLTSVLWSVVSPLASEKRKIEAFFITIAQFTNTRSIQSDFYQSRIIDDNQKLFIPHLAIDNDCFHIVFVNPCLM
jgi:hypothetical protein